jgi:UDP-N-acetylmuramyl pentapeptide phosphotransferase/UDP-N-acetylglucosamine-1-phosphate transferase
MSLNLDLVIIISSITVSSLFIYLSSNIFKYKKIIDQINQRSSHTSLATRSGGIALFCTVFLISCIFYILEITIFDFSILVPLSLLVSIGLYDDIYNLDFKLKFIFQIIVAKIIVDTGLLIDNFHGVLEIYEINRAVAQILTIFIITSIINAINFIDGIDGLAISVFSLFIILFEFFSSNETILSNLSLISVSSVLPLYYFNFRNNNKVFLGDSGSHFLGGIISIYVIFILSQDFIIEPRFDLHKIIFVFSILSYPIIDIIRIIFLRISNSKSPFEADKRHLHHILFKATKNHFLTTLIIVLFCILLLIIVQFLNKMI